MRYEYETYKEVNSRAPKLNSKVEVEGMGDAKVTEINVPCERVTLLLEDGKTVKIPLSEMEITGEGKRPNRVSADVIEAYSNVNKYSILESSTTLEVTTFTAEDKLADAVSCANCKMRNEEKEQSRPSRRPRRRQRNKAGTDTTQDRGSKEEKTASSNRKAGTDKQRQAVNKKNGPKTNNRNKVERNKQPGDSSRKSGKKSNNAAKRPGQKSSGLRSGGSVKKQQSQNLTSKEKLGSEAMPHIENRVAAAILQEGNNMKTDNYALLTDLYQLTMAQGYWECNKLDEQACFHAFLEIIPSMVASQLPAECLISPK